MKDKSNAELLDELKKITRHMKKESVLEKLTKTGILKKPKIPISNKFFKK